MSETPRLRSAFPATPRTEIRSRNVNHGRPNLSLSSTNPPVKASPITKPVQRTVPAQNVSDGPLIALDYIDAPTQRFYVGAFYISLLAWRIYNALNVTDELDSTWLFLKWIGIDAAFFVALPALRIPWLEWSFFSTLAIWILHLIANFFLMYNIPISIFGWFGAMAKVAWDRELAISEHRVKPADILHNKTIILGKQIIQILPEGSAVLNPEKLSFCLDSSTTSVHLPIRINQTSPISIELTRYDLDTADQESIVINQKQAKKLKYEADKGHAKSDKNTPRILKFPVSKKGLYRLTRVIDETKLEVRKRSYDLAVVPCPQASISVNAKDKCTGDLSGISLTVEGIPPFNVRYSKKFNQQKPSLVNQTIQPPDYEDNATDGDGSSQVVTDPEHPQIGWAQSKRISVDIDESLGQDGTWKYNVEEVVDGLGNKARFDAEKTKKTTSSVHALKFAVHGRPVASLRGCNAQKGLTAPEGSPVPFPVQIKPSADWPLELKYTFQRGSDAEKTSIETLDYEMSDHKDLPQITEAGRYSLESVATQYCQGEIIEPSVCSLFNPPKPDLAIQSEELTDKCAGNPVGMIVSFDFTGTPPFNVRYTKTYQGRSRVEYQKFDQMRGQIETSDKQAGTYTYQFLEVQDRVYGSIELKDRNLVLTQTIKPSASAHFQNSDQPTKACLDQPVSLPILLHGEPPWKLDYELIHGAKRKKFSVQSNDEILHLDLPGMSKGGDYVVLLTGVSDASNCRTVLKEDRHIEVRTERPSAAFGDVDGRRSAMVLEGKEVSLPLRLRGVGPWRVQIQNKDRQSDPSDYFPTKNNAVIKATASGTYEIISVEDSCPGDVDPKANTFTIDWIQRPALHIKDSSVEPGGSAKNYRKAPVCQGHEDTLNLALTGTQPYHLKYTQKSAQSGLTSRSLVAGGSNAVIKMDTSKAGEYVYTLTELVDDRYIKHDKHHFSPVVVTQQVHPLPSAKFTNAGKVYGYCKDDLILNSEGENEIIPITLTGSPPFSLEVAITHHGASSRPEIKRINDISSNHFSWALSRSSSELGSHTVQIRSVRDSRGCESLAESNPSAIRISVSAPPTITPLESQVEYCVGQHVSFTLSGQAPFQIFYSFRGREMKADSKTHEFRRIAEYPGEFVITSIADSAMGGGGKCRARKDIRKTIHPYPSVRIERGETKTSDIHEGGEVDIHFEFTGTPPFEFTYTRSENINPRSKSRNKKPAILETRHDSSTEFTKVIRASEEGTYEVVAIKDRYCSYSAAGGAGSASKKDQKLLKF